MKLKDICKPCALNRVEIDYYKEKGIFDEGFGQNSELTDAQIEILCTISLLREAGLNKERIAKYLSVPQNKEIQTRILKNLRGELLDAMHEKGKCIDKVDYLLHELQNKH